jgi:precorrin-2 dehydrogenase/sirohydrochlorin ferrochelatase
MGRLVNVEDRKDYCDFYFSSLVARGDLLIAVNTGGKSPALSVRIRKFLEKLFPQEWAVYLDELGQKRLEWKEQGMTFSQVNEQSNAYINGKGWLK